MGAVKLVRKGATIVAETGVFVLLLTQGASALNAGDALTEGADRVGIESEGTGLLGEGGIFERVAEALIILIGAISVIMLIIGGFRYVISQGDANAVEGAKNTILYAIVGIVVAFLSYGAVSFVINQLSQ